VASSVRQEKWIFVNKEGKWVRANIFVKGEIASMGLRGPIQLV